jgi:hypothetical protein
LKHAVVSGFTGIFLSYISLKIALISFANFLCTCSVNFLVFHSGVQTVTFVFVIYFLISLSVCGTQLGNNRCIRCFNSTSFASHTSAEPSIDSPFVVVSEEDSHSVSWLSSSLVSLP